MKRNNDLVIESLTQAYDALKALLDNQETINAIVEAGELIALCIKNEGKIMSCGNGGSLCDAMHFAEEMTGRYRSDRRSLPAIAISDSSHISCVGNDYGYDRVFARYVQAIGLKGDVLLAISTSGNSLNIVEAAKQAKAKGMYVIALVGKSDCLLRSFADVQIVTPGGVWADRVQELHIKVIHILIELVENNLCLN